MGWSLGNRVTLVTVTLSADGHSNMVPCFMVFTNLPVYKMVNPNPLTVVLSAVELPADSQKLKRHIALLCDRICKGGSLGGTKKEVIYLHVYLHMSLWVSFTAELLCSLSHRQPNHLALSVKVGGKGGHRSQRFFRDCRSTIQSRRSRFSLPWWNRRNPALAACLVNCSYCTPHVHWYIYCM